MFRRARPRPVQIHAFASLNRSDGLNVTLETPPNILLIMTDQHRADCLGIEGHPVLQTPHLDEIAGTGARFRRAYSACPLCIPARRTLMTGVSAKTHGVVGNVDRPLDLPTLPGLLRDAGYQTHLCGKLHLWPKRKRYGFESMDWSDGPYEGEDIGDYGSFLIRQAGDIPYAARAHGATLNSWVARPWHLADRLHFTNWCTDRALEFLDCRDPTAPYFLKISFFHPHTPCTPPAFYFDHYLNQELPEPVVGDWARFTECPALGQPVRSMRCALPANEMRTLRAGYFGSITHLDDQIGRILDRIKGDRQTVVLFVSDHGEMLGDHQYFQKGLPYEASARIPFLIRLPRSFGIRPGQVCDQPVELMDVMPTILDVAGVDAPESVEGRSVLPLLRGDGGAWRAWLHGECAQHRGGDSTRPDSAMHYLTDGRQKYVWRSDTGDEQLFDLEADPNERTDLIGLAGSGRDHAIWRNRLVELLSGRSERFVRDGALHAFGCTPPSVLP